jgi:hypothetical protein
MTTPIKTTLFNLKTSRAPELLTDDARQKYFIDHPDGSTGVFYTAVAGRPGGQSIREAMEGASETFTELDKDGVIAINTGMYEFAMKFLINRDVLVYADVNTAIGTVTALSSGNKITLWDNLFFQTITQQDPYVRECILYVLIANHLKENFGSVPATDEGVRMWAKSRVVMPLDLFGIETDYHTATTNEAELPNPDLVKKYVSAAESVLKAKLAKTAIKELSAMERDYLATQKANEASYVLTFNNNLRDAVESAPKSDVVDQFSGYTFKQFSTPFSIPPYTWTPDEQINLGNIEANTSDFSYFLLTDNNLLVANTYADVKKDVSDFVKEKLESAFVATQFTLESVDVNGTAIPICSLENRYNQKYSFYIKPVKKANNKYAILIAVDTKVDCIKLTSATLTCGFEYSKYSYSANNGVVTIDFTPDSSAAIDDINTTMATSGELTFNNGLVLSWSILMDMVDGSTGIMAEGTNFNGNTNLFIPSGYGLTRIGIAEYKTIEQYLCCYVPGEVSHIENVMAREYKERSTRRLRRSEDTTTNSYESESENQTDTTTTSRYDMQREVSSVLQQNQQSSKNQSFHVGVNAGVNTGAYSASLDASYDTGSNYALNSSKQQSNRDAVNLSKEVVQKALQRVVSKVKEERVVKIIEEFEEQNKHGFDNRLGSAHISGVYRWVDAKYNNELRNYGKRLQYEFMIPEPSAFHLIAKSSGVSSGTEVPIVQPLNPRKDQFGSLPPLKSSASITEDNYHLWAAAYNAEVNTPPSRIQLLGKSFKMPDDGQPWYAGNKSISENMVLPDGYGLNKAYVSAIGERGATWGRYYVAVGDNTREYWAGNVPKQLFLEDNENLELDKFSETVPVGIQFVGITCGLVTVSMELLRKSDHFAKWQLETYNAIITAYESRLQEYKDSLAELELKKAGSLKDNPAYYREIENIVLKKNCISYLIGHTNMGKSFVSGSETKEFAVNITANMDKYAASAKFFEQAFEWNIMSYILYPFYWAGSEKWTKLYNIGNDDPLYQNFLRAGMARVVVTVRPGFEESVMHYMQTGQIWNGGEVPVIGDNLYLSIIEELKEQEYIVDEVWETRVPTTLNVIQANSISLNAEGLPCWCDSETPPEEEFLSSEVLTSLEVFIEGNTNP